MKFSDFFKPSWKHSDPKIRTEAIKQLSEEYNLNDLKEIAIQDDLAENQKLALKKISNENALAEIANSSQQKGIAEQAQKKLNEIWSKKALETSDESQALDLVAKISDSKFIESIALNHKSINVRRKCMQALNNPNSLYKLALAESTDEIALEAFKSITKTSQYETLAKKATNKQVRLKAKEKLNTGVTGTVKKSDSDIALAKAEVLCSSMESLTKPDDWKEAKIKADELSKAWLELENANLPESFSGRFEKALAEFNEHLKTHEEKERRRKEQEKLSEQSIQGRREICEELEKISQSKLTDERMARVDELTAKWQTLPSQGSEEEGLLNNRYQQVSRSLINDVKEQRKNSNQDDSISRVLNIMEGLAQKDLEPADIPQYEEALEIWAELSLSPEHPAISKVEDLKIAIEGKMEGYRESHKEIQISNLDKLSEIVSSIEKLMENNELAQAEKKFKALLGQWRDLDHSDLLEGEHLSRFNDLQGQFDLAKAKFLEAQEWARWANLQKKQEITESLKTAIAENSDPKALYAKMRELQSEWKNIGPVSWDSSREIWEEYQKIIDDIYEKCQDYFEELAEERKSNLEAKLKLCELVEKEMESTRLLEATERVKDAQTEWKNIGSVPKENSEEVWTRFRNACDKFFSLRKEMHHELEKEKGENLAKKIELCELVESVKDSKEWKKTAAVLKKAQQDWKEIGPVPKQDLESIWERFRNACDFFFNARDAYFKELESEKADNLIKKEALIQKLDGLKDIEGDNEKFKFIKDLQAEWKGIGPVDKKVMNEIWERFRTPIDAFFEERKEKFEQEKQVREENLGKKEALCEKAEALAESNQWKATSEELKKLQAEWKQIGPAPREKDRAVWERFRAACDGFFNKMKDHYRQLDEQRDLNLSVKEDLCFQAEALAGFVSNPNEENIPLEDRNWEESSNRIKELQKKWKATGPVPKSKSDELWEKFRLACDYVFEATRVAGNEGAFDLEANLAAKLEMCESAEVISNQVHTDAQIQKIKDLQYQWKSVGPVPPEQFGELWKRFKSACDVVYGEDERLRV